jgi:hypothetical protein
MIRRIFKIVKDKRKVWASYLFEFILVFFAVYLSFKTENYRDIQEKKAQIKQYLNGIILDVHLDQKLAEEVIVDFEKRIIAFDSLSYHFQSIMEGEWGKFSETIKNTQYWADFYPTMSAYNQLRYGGFQLIKDHSVVDSINSYYLYMNDVVGETANLSKHFNNYFESQLKWCNLVKVDSLNSISSEKLATVKVKSFYLPNYESGLSEYLYYIRTVNSNLKECINWHKRQIERGYRLVNFLEKKLEQY